jgi:hypothetical protein
MAETWKMSSFLVSLIFVSLFVASFGLLISDVATNYGATYNSTTLSLFNKMSNLTSTTNEIKVSAVESSGKTGVVDILGDFFAAGYQSFKVSFSALGIMSSLIIDSIGSVGMGAIGGLLSNSLLLAIVVIFVFGIILKVLLKVEL